MSQINRICSDANLALHNLRVLSLRDKIPMIVDYLSYRGSLEFRIMNREGNENKANIIAECVKSRRSWKVVVVDFEFMENWNNKLQ